MPIYEFACSKCRVIFNFLSKRVNPKGSPACPKCGDRKLTRELSRFALLKGGSARTEEGNEGDGESPNEALPDLDDPKVAQAMSEMEREMEHLDESNPRHMARMLQRVKEIMPAGSVPKELESAIRRLEAGEDIEKIEAELGDVMDGVLMGNGGRSGSKKSRAPRPFSHDPGLYEM